MRSVALLACLLTLVLAGPSWGQGEIVPQVPCFTPEDMVASEAGLTRIGERIYDAAPISIVAFGSSSTFGTGASSPGASYPSQLQDMLRQSLPRSEVTVENRGVPGERSAEMLARLGRDVLDQNPDLLLWQLGTNSTLTGADIAQFTADVERGLAQMRAARIDVVLINPQYAPAVLASAEHATYLTKIATIARERRVALFRRFDAMRYWQDVNRMPAESLTGPDGLHMTDLGYTCLARSLARMIVKLARTPANRPRAPQAVAMPLKVHP